MPGEPSVDVGLSILRIYFQGFIEISNSTVILALLHVNQSQVIVQASDASIMPYLFTDNQAALVVSDSTFVVALAPANKSQVIARLGNTWV